MSMRTTDTIIGPSRGSASHANAYFRARGAQRIADVEAYVDAVYALCTPDDMPDAAVVVSAADVETGTFTNKWWRERLNAGSLGVTGWGPDDEKSPTFSTGAAAAKAHVAHLLLYASGTIDRHGLTPADDPRFAAYRAAYGSQAFPVLNDLSGRYAADTGYARTIVARSESIWGTLPDQGDVATEPPKGDGPVSLTFGKVPHPEYQNRPITKREGVGMNNLGKRTVKGVSWHRILGTLWGTDGFFRDPNVKALTDYGVGVLAQDGAANDGLILRWNDPLGYQSGWASGTYSAAHAYGDGAKFVNKYGVNAINRDRASIEISGFQTTPLSPKAKQAVAAITAYWADQARIPWDVFPIVPQDGFSFVAWHEEFGPDLGQKKCPFEAVKDATPEMIEMTRDILKQYQTAGQPIPEPEPTPEPIPEPLYPPGMTVQLARRLYGTLTVSWASKPFTFDPVRSECIAWLEAGKAGLDAGDRYDARDEDGRPKAHWPELTKVIRRGDGSRSFVYSDGTSFEQPASAERDAA